MLNTGRRRRPNASNIASGGVGGKSSRSSSTGFNEIDGVKRGELTDEGEMTGGQSCVGDGNLKTLFTDGEFEIGNGNGLSIGLGSGLSSL